MLLQLLLRGYSHIGLLMLNLVILHHVLNLLLVSSLSFTISDESLLLKIGIILI